MPTYDYKCEKCKTTFSISASFSSMLGCVPSCPCCKSEDVKKFISRFDFVLKGKDFYNTDNKKEESK